MKPLYYSLLVTLLLFSGCGGSNSDEPDGPDGPGIEVPAGYTRVDIVTPGSLKSLLSPSQLETITKLFLTGAPNASDFETMRDGMPSLAELDLRMTTITEIPAYAFWNKEKNARNTVLRTILLPDSVIKIKEQAFRYCSGLERVDLSSKLTEIEECAFYLCKNLKMIELPESLLRIESDAFAGCELLVAVALPSSLEYLGFNVFNSCLRLEKITIPTKVQVINPGCFRNCSILSEVQLSVGLKTIGKQVFMECGLLKKVDVPEGVELIDSHAFDLCLALTEVSLPSTLKEIGREVFVNCPLETIICSAPVPPIIGGPHASSMRLGALLKVPAASIEAYKSAEGWNGFQNIVPL